MRKRIEPLDNSIISKGVSNSAKDSTKQMISTMLGLLPSDQFSVTIRVSKHPLIISSSPSSLPELRVMRDMENFGGDSNSSTAETSYSSANRFKRHMNPILEIDEHWESTPSGFSHHLSLCTSSSELSAMEKLLQDLVPCKIRAKRGFATHPRSIAERVRRTKISERIRKMQELVPNMDKQTNTSDMLDLADDYIKDLQRQVKALSDNRAK